jgi:hypothetical protein
MFGIKTYSSDWFDLEEYYIPQSLQIEDEINARSTASFRVVDEQNNMSVKPSEGQPIEITDYDGNLVFGGFILYAKRFNPIGTDTIFYNVECVDNHSIADRFIVAESYVNTLAGDIVKDLRTTYLDADGVTIGEIQDGPTIDAAKFPRIGTVADALDELSELTGFTWYIDYDKKLYFIERQTFLSPFDVASDSAIVNINVKEDKTRYRNKQYIRGGLSQTEEISLEKPTPEPDGVSRTFVTRFPLASKPKIFIDSVEVTSSFIGANGVETGKKFYYTYNSNTITQDDAETVLNSEVIEVTYKGLFPLLVVSEDTEAIAERVLIEGGTGIYENIINESKVDKKQIALDIANGKLRKYTKIERELTYQTTLNGLFAGQLQTINLPKYNITDGEFLIDRVTISDLDGNGTFLYDVHAVDGEVFGGWTNFFKELVKTGGNLIIRDNEVLVILQTTFESQSWTEEISVQINACPLPGNGNVVFITPFQIVEDGPFPSEDLLPC